MHLTKIGLALLFALTMTAGESLQAVANEVDIPTGSTSSTGDLGVQLAQTPAAATTTSLTERSDYVGTCRGSGGTALPLYEDARLTRSVGTVPINTSVTLTGVLGDGVAQIRSPQVGWVRTATLTTACTPTGDGTLPADIDTNPRYCRRIRNSRIDGFNYQDLDNGLVAYETPGGSAQTYQGLADGPAGGAVVRVTSDPAETRTVGGRNWIRIRYVSRSGARRIGWVSNGPTGTNRNLALCLSGQN